MAVPVARVHLKVAHAALPALLPTPPKWKALSLLLTSCLAANLPKPLARPSRADADERWDARKTKPAATAEASASASSHPRSAADGAVMSSAGHGSPSPRKNTTTTPPPKPGRADSVERWDAHKKAAAVIPASSSSSSSGKWTISRASSAERWDVRKKRLLSQADQRIDNSESSSTVSNDVDTEEEEIVWKPRAMYAGPGFTIAAPESSMLPMPTAFLLPVA